MGFEGTAVTPHIKSLIEDYRLGAVLLNTENLVSAEQATTLIRDLQIIAHEARHPYPLLIAVDQENGLIKSASDPDWITQFPSSLGVAATGSTSSAYTVALMTAREMSFLGINWILGPALDVILDRNVPGFGSRSFGGDPEEVAKMGTAFIRGLKDGGVASLAKHFPLGGSLKFDESSTTVPVVSETLEQLRHKVLVPFREAIKNNVPAIMACGVAISSLGPRLLHACFSRKIVTELLREQLGFEGVIVSECLEMTSIAPNIGVGQATIMGIRAGCDLLTICRSLSLQVEAFASLSLALENGGLSWDSIRKGAERVMRLRAAHTSWSRALNPGGLEQMVPHRLSHLTFATRVYEDSITLIRDDAGNIPLTKVLSDSSTVLVLSPLLMHRASEGASTTTSCHPLPIARETSNAVVLQKGEDYFQNFGLALACYGLGQVLHTSYTSHGVREEHERLIDDADAIIIFVADALRNQYQVAFAKHVAAICKLGALDNNRPKRLILASVSSPFDFPAEKTWFGTLLCTYDSSMIALHCLARVLGGDIAPTGRLPRLGSAREVNTADGNHHQTWLVEQLNLAKDQPWLLRFFKEAAEDNPDSLHFAMEIFIQHTNALFKELGQVDQVLKISSSSERKAYVVIERFWSCNEESLMSDENLQILDQPGLIVTLAESGRAVAFLPLVARECPLARYIPSLRALPASTLALLCPVISQSASPEALSRRDILQQLLVVAVGDAKRQGVETLVAHAIPTSDLFAEVLMDTGFEREATFAVLNKTLSDT
ncbi:hypothetical protein N7532_002950 [Penicillium argentinense]|uniref:Glycoside hydrolase family 3 N-terminal domain-containing protein n=1 Tax=Penicillium argentinense TaxID=1131581 RepID=A0A9W9G1D0_9EURO|nr:uncharacterized protein N7532_002950 [Penicillium argentinense]KAJ5110305.1 hypothetical protein N7532_002950 [Penicillium argentinense]